MRCACIAAKAVNTTNDASLFVIRTVGKGAVDGGKLVPQVSTAAVRGVPSDD